MTRPRLVPNPESACPYERAGVVPEIDCTGEINPLAWRAQQRDERGRERDEAALLLSTRGYCYVWSPVVGRQLVQAPTRDAGGYDVDAGMREWDRLTSQRVRARGD